jgi:hypothetical protein
MVVLCQNPTDRIDLIIKLLDSAMYLFDTIHNFFGFSYIIEALDHIKVSAIIRDISLNVYHIILEYFYRLNG